MKPGRATLSFFGAVGTVTGSKYLVKNGRSTILVDCGLFQGFKELRERNWNAPPFDARALDAVVITHAHIDHTGYLPRLVKEGFDGPVYCSSSTAALMRILLPDAARLQEDDAHYRNKHGLTKHSPALPLYTEHDAHEALRLLVPVKGEQTHLQVAHGIQASFYNAGHIFGSRFVLLTLEGVGRDNRRVLFSGDLGRNDQIILRDPEPPAECDDLLLETTYGNRLHQRDIVDSELTRVINEAAQRGATVLVPAFAVGRTQEIVYRINLLEQSGKVPVLPVRVDSPMAALVTEAYSRILEEFDEPYRELLAAHLHPLRTTSMLTTSSREDSKSLNFEKGARILISAAGMMTGGRVLHHAQRVLPDENATILFAGFQAGGTTGRRILDGEKQVKIYGQWTPVRCHVEHIEGLSSHPDWQETLGWLAQIPAPPKRVFLVHGEAEAASAMQGHIHDRFGWQSQIPEYSEVVDLLG